MTESPKVLVLHDGEVSDVSELLDEMGLPYLELRGGDIPESLPAPQDLLIVTPRHATVVGRPNASGPRRLVRIISVEGDSVAMREMLRDMGFDFLVRAGTQKGIWRLLIQRACYQGAEKRVDPRVPVGARVSLTGGVKEARAVLIDISNRGCRVLSYEEMEKGQALSLDVPHPTAEGAFIAVSGRVVRVSSPHPSGDVTTFTAAMLFDEDTPADARAGLVSILNAFSTGQGSITEHADDDTTLPACESLDMPGFTLDDETDPAVVAGLEILFTTATTTVAATKGETSPAGVGSGHDVSLAKAVQDGADARGAERRRATRSAFQQSIVASTDKACRVLMGRDLSAGGMRVEPLEGLVVGEMLRIAIYGPAPGDPVEIAAQVVRDDGDAGFALRFDDVSPELARELEKLVACLPDVESLRDDESWGLGAIVSEILPDPE